MSIRARFFILVVAVISIIIMIHFQGTNTNHTYTKEERLLILNTAAVYTSSSDGQKYESGDGSLTQGNINGIIHPDRGWKYMPRQSRKLSKSKIYHVMIRGNERKEIFRDDEDKARFTAILNEKNKDKKYCIYAYCLMDNHVHLLINEDNDEISRIMKRINISYAYYFNQKYNRIGHLFQDRFKSESIETDSYLLAAARYIHRNPVKAGIVKEILQYRWSSYHAYINESTIMSNVVDTDRILEIFSPDRQKAVNMFIEYTNQDTDDNFFIEYKENTGEEKSMVNKNDARQFINGYLQKKDLVLNDLKNKKNLNQRDELIRELKTKSNLSIRHLAEMLGLDRNIIQRIK